jgi:hypothetical protein
MRPERSFAFLPSATAGGKTRPFELYGDHIPPGPSRTNLAVKNWKRGQEAHHREAGLAALDVFSEWKSIYIDYSGKIQKAQIDVPAGAGPSKKKS